MQLKHTLTELVKGDLAGVGEKPSQCVFRAPRQFEETLLSSQEETAGTHSSSWAAQGSLVACSRCRQAGQQGAGEQVEGGSFRQWFYLAVKGRRKRIAEVGGECWKGEMFKDGRYTKCLYIARNSWIYQGKK